MPESITLNIVSYEAKRSGDELQLVATILPENTTNQEVTGSSDNESLATVDANGHVTINPASKMLTSETATITVTSVANPKLTATCVIKLEEPSAVNDVNASKTIDFVKYYNVSGVESDQPFDGINMVVTHYTDGTSTVSKKVSQVK